MVGRLGQEAGHAELFLSQMQQCRVVIGPALTLLEGCHVQVQVGEEGELAPQPHIAAVVNPAAHQVPCGRGEDQERGALRYLHRVARACPRRGLASSRAL